MKNIKSERGSFELTTSIAIFLVCLIIALSVAAFHHWYFPTKYLQFKSTEIANLFSDTEKFSKKAKQLLNTREDISYFKLLDKDGVVEHSYGDQNVEESEKFFINAPENKTIVFGIKNIEYNQIDGFSLLWSFIIGSIISLVLLLVIFVISPPPDESIRRLLDAMKKLGDGDLTSRLPITPSVKADTEILGLYNEYNNIASNLENNFAKLDEAEVKSSSQIIETGINKADENSEIIMNLGEAEIVEEIPEVVKEEQPIENDIATKIEEVDENIELLSISDEDIINVEDKDDNFSLFSEDENKKSKIEETKKKIEKHVERVKEIKEEVIKPFKPIIVSNNSSKIPKNRDVTVLIAKISDFEIITNQLDPSELNAFITKYRNSASKIISEYGGVVEALFQDEIVAVFNVPKKQTNPELRSVSVAVEIMQLVAELARERKSAGKKMVSAKIGIGIDSVPFTNDNAIPDRIKSVVDKVRNICNNSSNWKILVSKDFYDSIKEFVDVKEEKVNNNSYYSITGVEEGVANL